MDLKLIVSTKEVKQITNLPAHR